MTHVIHRSLLSVPRLATKAEGIYIYDHNGKPYIDGSGGAAVSCIGHSHPKVVAAMQEQMQKFSYAHTGFFTSQVAEELADFLSKKASNSLNNAYFVSGGSEAVEAALKMARQYFVDQGQTQRKYFIARKQSYHGNTLGALAVGGNEWRRRKFEPLLIEVGRVSACYEYRGRLEQESQDEYTQRLLNEFEEKILELGADNVIGFVAEPVVGATAGAVPPTPGYFKGIRQLCDQYGVLFIADEVMCGVGRTGTYFAYEQEEIEPDIITMAKGLGGGYQPIGAILVSDQIIEVIKNGSGAFQHGHTYIGHPIACAAALAVQQVIQEENLVAHVKRNSQFLYEALSSAFAEYPQVGDIRGRGYFWGIEFVADPVSKRPYDPAFSLSAKIKKKALENHLVVYPNGGTIDGQYGDHVLIAPPFNASQEELTELVKRLQQSVIEAFESE